MYLLDNIPVYALCARGCSERAWVTPVVGHVDGVQELAKINRASISLTAAVNSFKEGLQENVSFAATFVNIEEDSQYGTVDVFGPVQTTTLNSVYEVELTIEVLAVDGVLGGGVEVELLWSVVQIRPIEHGDLELSVAAGYRNGVSCIVGPERRRDSEVEVVVANDFHLLVHSGVHLQVDGGLLCTGSANSVIAAGDSGPVLA